MIDQQARTAKEIGSAIRRIRRAKGLSQTELGEKVGLRQATISRLEAGKPNTRLETLLDAMSALGLEFVVRERVQQPDDAAPPLEDLF